MRKRTKILNCRKITRNGKTYWGARLTFDFDKSLGYKPPDKDFYGKTMNEADQNRENYKLGKRRLNEDTLFLDFVENVFLAEQKELAKAGNIGWECYKHKESRLRHYLIAPKDKKLSELAIRFVSLGNFAPMHVEEYFRKLVTSQVNQEYQYRLLSDIKAVLKLARSMQKLADKPDHYLDEIPKISLPKRIRPRVVYDHRQLFQVISDETKDLTHRTIVAFQLIMLCRPSEMWALQWKDIDLEKGVVHFYKAMRKSESSYNVSDGTKTGYKGVRTLPLGNTLLEMLTALRRPLEGQETASLRVFTGPRGEQINKDRFKSLWEKIEESLGLPPGPTFYSLKHLGNSFLASQNVNSEARAKRMGHTTDKMAKDVYRIDIPDENMQVVSVFDNQFKKESK